jgi:UDP-N-acetylmuramoyl-tripeptide--D-alanyl-D-alanine ligase
VYSCLAALAVADALHIDLVTASKALSTLSPTPGRMRLLEGIHNTVIIDDTYNSSPIAALSALDTLQRIEGGRRIAVLGDMRELGTYSAEAHRQVGKRAAEVVDALITVGVESRVLAEAARSAGLPDAHIVSYGYDESKQVGLDLKEKIKEGDVILIKGSQNRIRLERTVKELMAHPEEAGKLLVRQEREWLQR